MKKSELKQIIKEEIQSLKEASTKELEGILSQLKRQLNITSGVDEIKKLKDAIKQVESVIKYR